MNIEKISAGKNAPQEVNVLIEIPKGSNVKYEVDKASGALFVDRFLYTAMHYPFNYGFIPGTLGGDGDPVDAWVLSENILIPGSVIASVPIGVLETEDESGVDDKIITVPKKKIDPHFGEYADIKDIPQSAKDKIQHFLENYKSLEPGKWVKVKEWKGRKEAAEFIKKSMK